MSLQFQTQAGQRINWLTLGAKEDIIQLWPFRAIPKEHQVFKERVAKSGDYYNFQAPNFHATLKLWLPWPRGGTNHANLLFLRASNTFSRPLSEFT